MGRVGDGRDASKPGPPPPKSAFLAQRDLQRDLEIAERIGITLDAFYTLSEGERAEWVARWEVERDTCKFHGGPRSECADDDRDWFPQLTICQPSMQLAAAEARYMLLHTEEPYHDGVMVDGHFVNWSDKQSLDFPYSVTDGASIWIAPQDLGFGGDFLEQGLIAEQSPG